MKHVLVLFIVFNVSQAVAALATYEHLDCHLQTGNSSVFHDLRKFAISSVMQDYKRLLVSFDGHFGKCYNVEHSGSMRCEYVNPDNQLIEVVLDQIDRDTIDGKVYYDGIWDKSHIVNCNILRYPFEWDKI